MRQCLLLIGLLFVMAAHGQYKVTFILGGYPSRGGETVWIAGSFNGWNPKADSYALITTDAEEYITHLLPAGPHQFKCTRGSWETVEVAANGQDVGNRSIMVTGDTNIVLDIAAWKDDFAPIKKQHTASANVTILTDSFYMPGLNRYRRIWLYLPPGYAKGGKRYPVLYMHDGQNLFDEMYAPFGEWGVDECMDSLHLPNDLRPIIVGVENGLDKRMNEYNPYAFDKFGPGQGDAYVDFLVQTLKPYIDKHYRTQTGAAATTVAGSSMGGLISLYATLKYPTVFGNAGVFSPAFWTAPALHGYIDSLPANINARLFFYAGEQESKAMVPDMERIADKMALKSNYFMYSVVDPDGQHNEPTWRRWLAVFFAWIYQNKAE
jgi:predicted alpha/beta superfamily hydrolase